MDPFMPFLFGQAASARDNNSIYIFLILTRTIFGCLSNEYKIKYSLFETSPIV
jgi:hypothetical protein